MYIGNEFSLRLFTHQDVYTTGLFQDVSRKSKQKSLFGPTLYNEIYLYRRYVVVIASTGLLFVLRCFISEMSELNKQ